jgi:hypothetical protein
MRSRKRWSPLFAEHVLMRLEMGIFPGLGHWPIEQIVPPEVELKKVEKRGVIETSRRLRPHCSAIFRFGIACG